jgi:hypothetical protein
MESKMSIVLLSVMISGILIGTLGMMLYQNLDASGIDDKIQSGGYDMFWLSVGPYQNNTHTCIDHNVLSCDAEFKGKNIMFHIKSQDSSFEMNGSGFTTSQGWLDLYLPKNQKYTAEFEVEGLKGSGILTTAADSPTCISTIRVE